MWFYYSYMGSTSKDKLNELLKLQEIAARIILQVYIDTPSTDLFPKLHNVFRFRI